MISLNFGAGLKEPSHSFPVPGMVLCQPFGVCVSASRSLCPAKGEQQVDAEPFSLAALGPMDESPSQSWALAAPLD